jgi:hypothetical protein
VKKVRTPRAHVRAKTTEGRLDELIEEATVDAHDESEQRVGFYTMLENELALPFSTRILGIDVEVIAIELTDADEIVAICSRGRLRQTISITHLPLPTAPPSGAEWIAAYRKWAQFT